MDDTGMHVTNKPQCRHRKISFELCDQALLKEGSGVEEYNYKTGFAAENFFPQSLLAPTGAFIVIVC